MSEWRAYHAYYSDVDRLILGCVHPFLERWGEALERRCWERHYAGGPHLRIRLRGSAETLDRVGGDLVSTLESFLAAQPSPDLDTYSESRAAELLEREGTPADPDEDLRYRNNVVLRRPFPPSQDAFVSPEAAELMDDFRHDVLPLAGRILAGDAPRRQEMLRLYFLHALLVTGDLPRGSVSYKSHWEGFASNFPAGAVIERIRAAYRDHRQTLRQLLLEVAESHAQDALDADPVLAAWRDLVTAYRPRIRRALTAGQHFTDQPSTLEEAARMRERAEDNMLRASAFVRAFWSDERFLASIQYEPAILVPRVLVNLLYSLLTAVGLKPIDKFSLCYFSHRAVEEHFECDLNDILRHNINLVAGRHQHRWPDTAPRGESRHETRA